MYYLKPTREKYLEYRERGLELPLLLLFGDIHEYRTGMCESCSCEEKGPSCCVGLHMTAFLGEIDEIAKKTPVDFYTEFSKEMVSYVNEYTNVLFGDFHQALKGCYDVSQRTKPRSNKHCPTESIRFHYVDSRFMEYRLEGLIYLPIRELIGTISRSLSILGKFQSSASTNKTPAPHQIKPIFYHTLFDLGIHLDFETKEEFDLEEMGAKIGEALVRMLVSDKDIATKTHEMTQHLFTALDSVRGGKQSAIFRQLDKLGIAEWRDKNLWIEWMTENLLNMPVYQHYMAGLQESLQDPHFHLFLESLYPRLVYKQAKRETDAQVIHTYKTLYYPLLRTHLESLQWAFTIFYTKAMDAYFLGRLFKQPTGNASSTLSLGFFGDFHTRSIVQFLQQPLFGYETVVVASTDLVNYNDPRIRRCVEVNVPIYLYRDVQEHHRLRFDSAGRKELLLRYKGQLRREKNARTVKQPANHRNNKNQGRNNKSHRRNNNTNNENW